MHRVLCEGDGFIIHHCHCLRHYHPHIAIEADFVFSVLVSILRITIFLFFIKKLLLCMEIGIWY